MYIGIHNNMKSGNANASIHVGRRQHRDQNNRNRWRRKTKSFTFCWWNKSLFSVLMVFSFSFFLFSIRFYHPHSYLPALHVVSATNVSHCLLCAVCAISMNEIFSQSVSDEWAKKIFNYVLSFLHFVAIDVEKLCHRRRSIAIHCLLFVSIMYPSGIFFHSSSNPIYMRRIDEK